MLKKEGAANQMPTDGIEWQLKFYSVFSSFIYILSAFQLISPCWCKIISNCCIFHSFN